jgi:GT2 family glycosyltransferase
LLEALRQTYASDYPADRLELIVVDNASTDGTADAVAERHPDVRLIHNPHNIGAPGWNSGFRAAGGDYVLILDDDAYLTPGALRRAVEAARAQNAGLVSFSVVSSSDDSRRLNDDWDTGLLSFWGCAALVSAPALAQLGGYDPELFIWANEAELTMRLLDAGYRHLHLPEVRAIHMKERIVAFEPRRYLTNARHHAYIAAKLMRPGDALISLANIVQRGLIDGIVDDRAALGAIPQAVAGFRHGLLHRHGAVRPEVSAAYRRNFHPYASPWRFMRSPAERLGSLRDGRADERRADRRDSWFAQRAAFYPRAEASLRL